MRINTYNIQGPNLSQFHFYECEHSWGVLHGNIFSGAAHLSLDGVLGWYVGVCSQW